MNHGAIGIKLYGSGAIGIKLGDGAIGIKLGNGAIGIKLGSGAYFKLAPFFRFSAGDSSF